jgi:hypothetical protein
VISLSKAWVICVPLKSGHTPFLWQVSARNQGKCTGEVAADHRSILLHQMRDGRRGSSGDVSEVFSCCRCTAPKFCKKVTLGVK